MDRSNEARKELLQRLVDRLATGTTDQAPSMCTEDAAEFLAPARHARERQQFFLDAPHVIGFAGEVRAPGSYMTADVMGTPVLVARDREGALHAMINACAHRGARIATGAGTRAAFTCRFHGWTYALDGTLRGRPQDACFDGLPPERCGLARLPVSDRSGLIVIGLQPGQQAAVDSHLAEIEPELAGLGLEQAATLDTRRYEVAANWKLVAALSYESYHFATLHRDTVATMFAPGAVCDFFGRHSRWCFALKGTEKLKEQDPGSWPDAMPAVLSHQFFPGTVVILTWEIGQILRAEPGPTVDSCVVHSHAVALGAADREALRANFELGQKAFETEDLVAALETQQGLRARQGEFHVGRNEPVLQFWCEQWRRLRDE